jgi:CDP-diacylglycerol--glycerol-3-phosphate 3-phosphatidyltransferase
MTDPSAHNHDEVWNVPNKISAARLALSVVVFILIPLQMYWAALIAFVTAAGTDWVDGWYARKYNQVTKLGRILDPFCDKILICGVYILIAVEMNGRHFGTFPWYAQIAGWMAVVVVGRELLVTVLRSMIEGAGGDFSAKMAGKLKMWFQCIAVGACLVALALKQESPDDNLPTWLFATMIVSVWVSVASTVQSGWQYVQIAAKTLTE